MSQLQSNLTEILRQKSQYLLPQNLRSGITLLGITGTYGGQDTINLFIQETEPETYDGIWIETDSLEYDNIVEVTDKTSLVANSINIVKGSDFETILFYSNNGFSYRFNTIILTDSDNEVIEGINVYYGDGSTWKNIVEYTRIEYIQSSGTQYINTGIYPTNNTKLIIEYAINSGNGTNLGMINYFGLTVYSNRYSYGFGGSGFQEYSHDIALDAKTKTQLDNTGLYENDALINAFSNPPTFSYSNAYRLFAYLSTGGVYASSFKLYSCKLYENNILVRDFIPVKDPDSVVCLYDKVSGEYFYNAGTGAFIAGLEIN